MKGRCPHTGKPADRVNDRGMSACGWCGRLVPTVQVADGLLLLAHTVGCRHTWSPVDHGTYECTSCHVTSRPTREAAA